MTNIADEILKTIKYAIDKKTINCDRTFKTGIKKITKKGYVVQDETGCERTVPCAIPGAQLKPGQMVWVSMPCGQLNEMFISGIG